MKKILIWRQTCGADAIRRQFSRTAACRTLEQGTIRMVQRVDSFI
ncbi:hypothetical protein [Raoultella sp. HC6]|nr:hypothetical protein [Raoultella sp. HC6]